MSDVGETFGELLYHLIGKAGMSVPEFAKLTGVHKTDLSAIRAGDRKAPAKHLDKWAKTLELKGAEKDRFLDLAAMDRVPERLRVLIEGLEAASGKSLREMHDKLK